MSVTKAFFNDAKYDWLNINSDNLEELETLYQEYEISDEVLTYALDRNERAHLEYDEATQTFFLIYHVPDLEKIDNHYETIPMTFIIKDNHLITVSSDKTDYVVERMKKFLDNKPDATLFEFLFSSLFLIAKAFFPLVEDVDYERKLVSSKLKVKTTKKNLLALSDLETGIVYLVSASKQNVVLLEQIKAHSFYRGFSESEKEQLDDAIIEAKQLVEMTVLASQILQQLTGSYNNVLNNNLNDTMKILTVLSLLLTLPTIVTGFFGMNMPLPLEHNPAGWVISIFISLGLWFVLAFILRGRI
ncbi:magnesium transporter CorA family protein [Listeria floridensis]|uniref:magnesium transporter CorA family protein n=1 Tax=Listeria floridensis TaxID=1494962 RepID=UPI0004B80B61|nr:magnesium transporter CorA family protein [Listeria floridensis]